MTKSGLLQSAHNLKVPSPEASSDYQDKLPLMVDQVDKKMISHKDLHLLIGENNTEMMLHNHKNHGQFMSSMFQCYQPEVLVETIVWVFNSYQSHGFKLAYWEYQLSVWVRILQKQLLPKSFEEILPFYQWMIENQENFANLADEKSLAH